MYMIYFVVQQKLTQHCKAVILQFKRTKSQESQERALTASRAYDNCALQELFFLYFETTQEATQWPTHVLGNMGISMTICKGLPQRLSSKESVYQSGGTGDLVWSMGWEDALEKGMATHSRQRNLAGYSPWGSQESNTTEDTRWFLKAQRSGWNQIYKEGRNLKRKRQDFWKAANTLGMWTYLLNNWRLSRSSGSRTLWSFSGWAPAFAFCSAAAASCRVPRVLSELEQNQGSKSGETLAHLSLPTSLPISRLSLETWPFKRHRKGQTGFGPDLAD